MVDLRCPDCGSTVEGAPGQEAVCLNCGFRAAVPPDPKAASKPIAPPPRHETGEPRTGEGHPPGTVEAFRSLPMWAYLVSVLAVGTFFLAQLGLPFILGFAGLGLGLASHVRQRDDRRGPLAMGFSGAALLFGVAYLFA